MRHVKSALLMGAGVMAVSLGSLGVASAATNSPNDSKNSLVSKIAAKFHLQKSEVQAVFDQDHADHMADLKAKRATALKQAVSDGKLTQAEADHITAVWQEIDDLVDGKRPDQQSTATRDAIKAKMDALRTWANNHSLDLRSMHLVGGPHAGGFGHERRDMGQSDQSM